MTSKIIASVVIAGSLFADCRPVDQVNNQLVPYSDARWLAYSNVQVAAGYTLQRDCMWTPPPTVTNYTANANYPFWQLACATIAKYGVSCTTNTATQILLAINASDPAKTNDVTQGDSILLNGLLEIKKIRRDELTDFLIPEPQSNMTVTVGE